MCCIRPPAKDGKGDQVHMYNRLNFLLKNKYKVDLIYFEMDKNKKTDFDNELLQEYPIKFSYRIHKNLIYSIFTKTPFQVMFFKSNKYKQTFNLFLQKRKYSFIYSCLIRNNENIATTIKSFDIYIDAIDSMALNALRRMNNTKNFLLKNIIKIEYLRLKNYEKNILNKKNIKKIFFSITYRQRVLPHQELSERSFRDRCNQFPFRKKVRTNDIVFFGNLNYFPNVQAVHWFVGKCWPKIIKVLPNTRLLIVGAHPTRCIKKLNSNKIIVTGRVLSINKYLQSASISIAPLFNGSGMQFKILEAMCSGVPVITTNIGLGGISDEAKKFTLIHDDPTDFARESVKLILNKEKNLRIGRLSRRFIEENHCSRIINNKFIKEIFDN